ncbi:hypothetical protein ckin116_03820 [Helicobacter pylori]
MSSALKAEAKSEPKVNDRNFLFMFSPLLNKIEIVSKSCESVSLSKTIPQAFVNIV